jgi:PKD repeat protein
MRKAAACLLILLVSFLIVSPLINHAKAEAQPTVALTPSQTTATQLNQVITVNISVSNVQNLWLWDAGMSWDPTVLTLLNITEGTFLTQTGTTLFVPTDPHNGVIFEITDTLMSNAGSSGSGDLAVMKFQVISKSASTTISLNGVSLEGPLPPGGNQLADHPVITSTSDHSSATVSFVEGGVPAANAGPNQGVLAGSQVTFDGSGSMTSGSNPTYTWTFSVANTTQTLTGKTATYTFSTAGVYTVTLTLTDSNGQSNATTTITVGTKPVANIKITGLGSGQSASVNQQITFDASGSNGTIQKYLWDMGDGSPAIQTTNTSINYAYGPTALDMTYNVTLTVSDATGLNDTAKTSIKVLAGGVGAQSTTPPDSSSSSPSVTPSGTQDSTPAPTSSDTSNASPPPTSSPASNLSPTILAIIIVVTIVVLGGSTFWLRRTVESDNKKGI